jgi:hypothetical protein
MITVDNAVRSGHPVRRAVADCSSSAHYYDEKWEGLCAASNALVDHELHIDPASDTEMGGYEGRQNFEILTSYGVCVGWLVTTWFWTGLRWEMIFYIS